MSQFPRRLRVGDDVLVHYRIVNPPRRGRTSLVKVHTSLVQDRAASPVTMTLPLMEAQLDSGEALNLHLFLPIDRRFEPGSVRVDSRFEADGVSTPSRTAAVDRLDVEGHRETPLQREVRLCPALEPEALVALYIGAMERADLGAIHDRLARPGEAASDPTSLEERCVVDALAIRDAVQADAPRSARVSTGTGVDILDRYRGHPLDFATGFSRRDLPLLLGWDIRYPNAAAFIRCEGFTFKAEAEWMKRWRSHP